MKKISVEDAVGALVTEAEAHEKAESGEFCAGTRASMIVFAMLHLGLGLDDIGFIAVDLAHAIEVNDENLAKESNNRPMLVTGAGH